MSARFDDALQLQGSTVYREFLVELEEINRHKWIESEKAGEDIGFEKALIDWVMNHRAGWLRYRQHVRARQAQPAPASA
jgi:hypothetical protein